MAWLAGPGPLAVLQEPQVEPKQQVPQRQV
jgi:hypothetical protein